MENEYKILVVDDEEHYRILLKDFLSSENFNVDEASSGNEAIDIILQNYYDMVLLDIKMEGMDGIDTLKQIKNLAPETDVIIITGYADIPSAIECIKYGAREFLEKPLRMEKLLEKIKSTIRSREEEKHLREIQVDFPTLVMHKLQTPLNSAKSAIILLHKGLENIVTEKQKELLEHIDQTLWKIDATINDLIDLAKLESSKAILEKLPVNLDEFIPAVCIHRDSAIKSKQIDLSFLINKNIPTIEVDPEKLEKVIINILDNSIRYTEPGGTIKISATTIHREIDGKLVPHIEISITDTGTGIPEDKLPFIFNKIKPDFSDKEKTTGLGLALCKLIVEAHNGFITAESTVGKGTTIRLALPMSSDL